LISISTERHVKRESTAVSRRLRKIEAIMYDTAPTRQRGAQMYETPSDCS
jgi:hypothetical protein